MAKTTLTIEVEYDPTITDPDNIATAVDRLIETALSTPGILDEYGDPAISDSSVAGPIVIVVDGGNITDIGSRNGISMPVVVIDYDIDGLTEDDDERIVSVPQDDSGKTSLAWVSIESFRTFDGHILDFVDSVVTEPAVA